MSGNRNRYTSAPMYGIKYKKNLQKADFTSPDPEEPRSDDTESGAAPEGAFSPAYPADTRKKRSYSWLLWVLVLLLGLLAASFILPGNTLKIAFLVLTALTLLTMWGVAAFGKNARTSISLIYIALMIVAAVALIVSSPIGTRQPVARPTNAVASTPTVNPVIPTQIPEDNGDGNQGLPNDAGASAAQLQLMAFMNLWSENQLDQMVTLCKPDWVNNQKDPKTALFFLLTNRTPLNYTVDAISGSSADDSRTITITALISKASTAEPEYYRIQVLMIRINNNWYVDPNSLGGSKVTVSSGSAGSDGSGSQITTVPTSVPTPTAVPGPSTVLYYNPDGGKYYHAVDNCPSVGAQYLPLTALNYTDLNSTKFKSLLPCPKCNPPERPSLTGN